MSIVHDDLIDRSVNIHWPDGHDPSHADLFAHKTVIIDGPAATIWARLTDGASWPAWYSNARDVVVHDPSGTLGEGVTFDWATFGLKIASTIAEYVPHTRIGWYRIGDQLRAYHTWLLMPRNGTSTYVVMEDQNGPRRATPRPGQSRPHAPRSRPVEHQPQVRARKLTARSSGAITRGWRCRPPRPGQSFPHPS